MTLTWWEAAARAFEAPAFKTPHSVHALIAPDEAENPPYLQLIDKHLEDVLAGRTKRLLVTCPPQHGKSTRIVRAGVSWWLHHRPGDRVIVASFSTTTAERWGRVIRNDIEAHPELGLRIRKDSRSAGRWDLQPLPGRDGGSVYCVGVGGALTGRPADCVSGDTLIECEYGRITAAEAYARGITRIRSYDHTTGRAVWGTVEAARRIPGRRVVEVRTESGRVLHCTPDHRVYTSRGYLPAGRLRHGETLVGLVAAGGVPVRGVVAGTEDGSAEVNRPGTNDVLLRYLCASGHLGSPTEQVLRVRAGHSTLTEADVLSGVHGREHSDQAQQQAAGLRAVRGPVPAAQRELDVLRPGLRRSSTLHQDARHRELALQGRPQLREVVPPHAPADPGTRRAAVRALWGYTDAGVRAGRTDRDAVSAGGASHRRGQAEQLPAEPHRALSGLSHEAPQVEADTVSVVASGGGAEVDVYDFQVAGTRNFFGGGLLVHNCMIIDDPVKGRAWAESDAYRTNQEMWFKSDARTRLGGNSAVIMIATRWHSQDLMGLVQEMEPGRWTVLNLPALAEEDDPLGREPGEALGGVRGQTREFLEETRDSIGPYAFASLYQGRPAPAEGGLFKRTDLRYWDRPDTPEERRLQRSAAPGEVFLLDGNPVWRRDCYVYGTVDLAASTKTSADYTVAAIWAHTTEGNLLLLDLVRARVDDTRHGELIMPLLRRWNPDFMGVEDSGRSVNLTTELGRQGVAVRPLKADVDKITRALPATAKVARRQLWLPRAEDTPWLDAIIAEMLGFPNGNHDDFVDCLSYSARIVMGSVAEAVGVRVPWQGAGASLLDGLGPTPVAGRGRAGVPDFNRVQF